jgi:hypothetical protein
MMLEGRSPLLNFFMAVTMASFDWLDRLGMLGPALPPLVPWQPAQAFDSIAGVGAAKAPADVARMAADRANLNRLVLILISSFCVIKELLDFCLLLLRHGFVTLM